MAFLTFKASYDTAKIQYTQKAHEQILASRNLESFTAKISQIESLVSAKSKLPKN